MNYLSYFWCILYHQQKKTERKKSIFVKIATYCGGFGLDSRIRHTLTFKLFLTWKLIGVIVELTAVKCFFSKKVQTLNF